MKREDFIFDHMDDEYEDYWFKVVGDTKDELTKKYMEMCMVSVTEVVYSNKEQVLGIKRLFPFNYDVIMPDDTELKDMLESLVNEVNGRHEETEAQLYLHRPRLRPVYGKGDGYKIQLHRVQRMVWELYCVSRCC